MNGTAPPVLFEADCATCRRPYVGALISTRPELCHPCFVATLETP